MEVKRRKFQGVVNILSFNRHFYVFGILTWIFILFILFVLNSTSIFFWIINLSFLYGLFMPLLISAYVYDFSQYYNFSWLDTYQINDSKETRIVNINAGFDETSYGVQHKFPKSHLQVFDFYNSEKHTEPAIVRARKVSQEFLNTKQISTDNIPLEDNSVDVVFLLSAAHEIRNQEEKKQFLKECKRICKSNGKVIMVEHLRDFPNFLAFSIGFTHFFSRKTWKQAFKNAGFNSIQEVKFTPFMSVFNCN